MGIIRSLRYALQRYHHPNRYRYLRTLWDHLDLTPEQMAAEQQRRIEAIVEHAIRHIPYYHGLQWRGELSQLPILHRQQLRQQLDQLIDPRIDPTTLLHDHTGGSTGTPIPLYHDREKLERLYAGQYRSFSQCGWRPGERILQFWGATRDLQPQPKGSLDNLLQPQQTLAAQIVDESRLHHWSQTLLQFQPIVVRGYPSILDQLARYLLEERITLRHPPKGVFATAETLYPEQRKRIEAALQCKLFNQYGCREIPNIACECRHGQMHIHTDLVAVESIPGDGAAELLITALTNHTLPLIRYAVGDHGTLLPEPCDCGSPFPLLSMSFCRNNDLIETPEGQSIHPTVLIHLLDGIPGIERFQFIHDRPDRIRLLLVGTSGTLEPLQRRLQQRLRQRTGSALQLALEPVTSIPTTLSGKHRFIRSELSSHPPQQ